MPYKNCKIYSDGGHYIAIPSENFSLGKPSQSPKKEQPHKAEFESAYKDSQTLPKKERKGFMKEQLKDCFKTEKETSEFIDKQTERKRTNAIKRRVTLMRKVNLQQEWNYFVTFTYDSNKLDENAFKQKLMNTLKHLVSRKQWKYVGVWERSPEKQRLHFHGIFYIPKMIGELKAVTDYDTIAHRKQTTYQNTHFLKHFGRNDFKALMPNDIDKSIRYILKYIEKSGEKLCYGGKLPTYIKGHILDDDVLCPYGVADKKLLLFDDFTCIDDNGVVWGKASPEVIKNMPKTN